MSYFLNQTYPATRLRRNRQADWSRRLVAENSLSPNDLIWPIFVHDDPEKGDTPIDAMPGVSRYNLKSVPDVIKQASDHGIPAVALFPHVSAAKKDANGSEAHEAGNIICQAIELAKTTDDRVGIICDVALDPFTSHGHDGVLCPQTGQVLNEETIEILVKQALVQAQAGCDVLAPSDMMDGRVGAIRQALESEGFKNTQIMSYAAKYASKFYGPFRDAVGSADLTGEDAILGFRDKRGYQMDPANAQEALREVALDIAEGADMLLVKPGLPYLDIVRQVADFSGMPVFSYHVSGEYAMLKAAAEKGWLDYEPCLLETLLSFKRAGASGIITYGALDAAKLLTL